MKYAIKMSKKCKKHSLCTDTKTV